MKSIAPEKNAIMNYVELNLEKAQQILLPDK